MYSRGLQFVSTTVLFVFGVVLSINEKDIFSYAILKVVLAFQKRLVGQLYLPISTTLLILLPTPARTGIISTDFRRAKRLRCGKYREI